MNVDLEIGEVLYVIDYLAVMKQQSAFSFVRDGNILISKIDGAINRRDAERAFDQLKVQVSQFGGAPWANLIDTRHWGLNAADTDQILIDIDAWVGKHGRTHRVFVIGTEHAEIKKFWLKKYLGNILKKDQENIVETTAEAASWLATCGFHLKSDIS